MGENIAHPKRIEYYGQTKDDLFHGFGKAFYRSGELYIGNWYKGKRHGKGTLFFRKGDRYTGYWKNDQMDGDGTMITGPGIKYKGNFKNNRKHGEATITYINGKTFYEKWEDGVLIYHQSHDPKDDVESEIDIEETKEIINKKLNSNSFKIKPRREENDEKYKQQKHHIVEDKLENVEEKLNVPVVRPTNQNTSNKTIVNTKLNDDSVVINNLSKIVQESKNIQEWVNFNDLKKWLNNNDMNGMVLVGIKKEDLIKYFQDKSPAKETNNIQKEIQEMDMGSIVDITKKKIIQDIINNDNKDITTFTGIIKF